MAELQPGNVPWRIALTPPLEDRVKALEKELIKIKFELAQSRIQIRTYIERRTDGR